MFLQNFKASSFVNDLTVTHTSRSIQTWFSSLVWKTLTLRQDSDPGLGSAAHLTDALVFER